MKPKVLKIAVAFCLLLVAGYAAELLFAQTADRPGMKAAIVGNVTSADAVNYQTLTDLSGRSQSFLFKGYIALDPANVGAANVLKATITGASDVPCEAGAVKEWNAVSSDTVQLKIAVGDKVNIVGEEVAGNLSAGPF